ncbi:MAG: class I SAM-dependent methyltransferase [Desulfobacteraceae bacterium]|jgi:methyltransferase-like protein/SAM-dependent methyltransferase
MNDLQNTYERIPYPDFCYTQTHPDRLATIGRLLGLDPAPLHACRVLELGCASGVNLIPMAESLPGSEFVGLDFAENQICVGSNAIAELNLSNIRLLVKDLLDVTPEMGRFDYIIAHGVFSWVPEPVRQKILQICRQHLAPNGMAYVSYNTLPGWHMLGALREMMLYRTRHEQNPHHKVKSALELMRFLADTVANGKDASGTFLGSYGDMIRAYNRFVEEGRQAEKGGNELLLHDELGAVNKPFYFFEFIKMARNCGLKYVAEAEFSAVTPKDFSPEVVKQIQTLAKDTIDAEQYMDFLRNRTFRQTLLCHEANRVNRAVRPEALIDKKFSFATKARDAGKSAVAKKSVARYEAPDGTVFATDHPVTKAALSHLICVSPLAVPFTDLLTQARTMVYGTQCVSKKEADQDQLVLAANLLQAYCYSMQLVELRVGKNLFQRQVNRRPLASPFTRYQAQRGTRVVNRRHEPVALDDHVRHLVRYLDGTRDRKDLLNQLTTSALSGKVQICDKDGNPIIDPKVLRPYLDHELDGILNWLARSALLVE